MQHIVTDGSMRKLQLAVSKRECYLEVVFKALNLGGNLLGGGAAAGGLLSFPGRSGYPCLYTTSHAVNIVQEWVPLPVHNIASAFLAQHCIQHSMQ
jgi:hypothetical protein